MRLNQIPRRATQRIVKPGQRVMAQRRGVDYSAGGFDPALVLDYEREFYRDQNGNRVGFFDVHAHTATSPMTMRDGSGLLKWGPHNSLIGSAILDGPSWQVNAMIKGALGANGEMPLSGNATGNGFYAFFAGVDLLPVDLLGFTNRREIIVSKPVGLTHVLVSDASATNGQWFNIETKTVGTTIGSFIYGGSITDIGGGRLLLGYNISEGADASNFSDFAVFFSTQENINFDRTGAEEITVEAPRAFRFDLGGMVNNPDRGDSYVPTDAIAVFLPRRGHNPTSGKKGILIEPKAATNAQLDSNNLDILTTTWTITRAYFPSQTAQGPDGRTSLWEFTSNETATNLLQLFYNNGVNVDAGVPHCQSWFVRKKDVRYVQVRAFAGPGNFAAAVFDLDTGAVSAEEVNGTFSAPKGFAEDWGNGLWRLTLRATNSTAGTWSVLDGCDSPNPARDGTSGEVNYSKVDGAGYYVGFCQLESGSVPSSYIPTQDAAETRDAETLDVLNTALAYDAAAMSQAMEGAVSYADNNIGFSPNGDVAEAFFSQWRKDSLDFWNMGLSTTGAFIGLPAVGHKTGGQFIASFAGDDLSPGIAAPYRIAARLTSSQSQFASNGVSGAVDGISNGIAALSGIDLRLAAASVDLTASNGPQTIALFRQWSDDIGEDGLVEATT